MASIRAKKKPAIAGESWFKTRWRPAMAWLYMALIFYDFIFMPIGWPVVAFLLKITPIIAWAPLTLQGGGFIHITFGAILGLYTWGRTQEVTKGVTADTSAADDEDDMTSTVSKSDVP